VPSPAAGTAGPSPVRGALASARRCRAETRNSLSQRYFFDFAWPTG